MSKRRFGKKGASLGTVLALLTVTFAAVVGRPLPAAALEGYTNGRMSLVTEPEAESSPYVAYHTGGEEVDWSQLTWVDGRNGKAVALDGVSQYLQVGDTQQLASPSLSFATWIYWQGPVSAEADPTSAYSQRLFTMTNRNGTSWLSFAPHAVGEGGMNGVYVDFYKDGGEGQAMELRLFNEAGEYESYGLPMNEWHHIAVVMDSQHLYLYLDGRVWFQQDLLMGANELRSSRFIIGNGSLWEGAYFHGLIDDTALYDFALSADQVKMLYGDVDPLAEGATVPENTTAYLPSAPTYATTTTTAPTTTATQIRFTTLWGIPVWAVAVIGGLIVVFVGSSIGLSVYESKRKRTNPTDDGGKGEKK